VFVVVEHATRRILHFNLSQVSAFANSQDARASP
jgi:hypothetical protein